MPKGIKGFQPGKDHWSWKGGMVELLWNNPEYRRKQLKIWRHKKGISNNYRRKCSTPEESKSNRIRLRKSYKYSCRDAGFLPKKTIRMIYEDNVKKYGTLTCIYCLTPVAYGKDSLEHKQPISRGGTNEYDNLAVACRKCNSRKHTKTEQEFREERELL